MLWNKFSLLILAGFSLSLVLFGAEICLDYFNQMVLPEENYLLWNIEKEENNYIIEILGKELVFSLKEF